MSKHDHDGHHGDGDGQHNPGQHNPGQHGDSSAPAPSRRVEFQIIERDEAGEPTLWRAWACARPDSVWEAGDLGEVVGLAVMGAEEALGLEIELVEDRAGGPDVGGDGSPGA